MASNIQFESSVLFVQDITRSVKFYTEILDQDILHDFGRNVAFKPGIALWEPPKEHIIPQNIGEKSIFDESANRGELYFETTDIEAVLTNLKKTKVKFLHEIHSEPWGQNTIRFFDPDNHLIEIGETLETFVKRLYSDGLSQEQVSEKTGIELEMVNKLVNQ